MLSIDTVTVNSATPELPATQASKRGILLLGLEKRERSFVAALLRMTAKCGWERGNDLRQSRERGSGRNTCNCGQDGGSDNYNYNGNGNGNGGRDPSSLRSG